MINQSKPYRLIDNQPASDSFSSAPVNTVIYLSRAEVLIYLWSSRGAQWALEDVRQQSRAMHRSIELKVKEHIRCKDSEH
jgi:hypothetical protein